MKVRRVLPCFSLAAFLAVGCGDPAPAPEPVPADAPAPTPTKTPTKVIKDKLKGLQGPPGV